MAVAEDFQLTAATRHVMREFVFSAAADGRLSAATCARHLALLGATPAELPAGGGIDLDTRPLLELRDSSSSRGSLSCGIPWRPLPAGATDAAGLRGDQGELLAQAVSGLMAVNGRSVGRPRRLGLEMCSVAAGVLAAAGLLAASIARRRGIAVRRVETSTLEGALCFLRHHLAIATSGGRLPRGLAPSGPDLLLTTADGHVVELDALTYEGWSGFWLRLGADRDDVARGWLPFVFRYNLALCALPEQLGTLVGNRTLREVTMAAGAGVAVRTVRGYREVIADTGVWGTAVGPRAPWTVRAKARPGAPYLDLASPAADLPLRGLKVVEVTSRVQGPLAGLLLQMLGAEVTRVEPLGGDPARLVAPLAGPAGAIFMAYNAGKRAVELDYKTGAGRLELEGMTREADVFLHNWPPGRAEKLELDYPTLARCNPSLVYCHASGWPEEGDQRQAMGTDALVQAHLGFGAGMSPVGEPLLTSKVTVVDVLGGLVACQGILAGLHLRSAGGGGAWVNTSLASAAMTAQEHVLQALEDGRESGRRLGRPLWGTLDRPLSTASGFLVLSVAGEQELEDLWRACDLPDKPPADREISKTRILNQISTRTAAQWEVDLGAAGVPAAAVRTDLSKLSSDPLVSSLLEQVGDQCLVPRSPWRFIS